MRGPDHKNEPQTKGSLELAVKSKDKPFQSVMNELQWSYSSIGVSPRLLQGMIAAPLDKRKRHRICCLKHLDDVILVNLLSAQLSG